MKNTVAALWVIAMAIAVSAFGKNAGADEWVSLFNGKDIEGWEQKGGEATYKVEDGCIVGTTKPRTPNSFLCPQNSYGDFELTFDVKCDEDLNSGVQIRSTSNAAHIPAGLRNKRLRRQKGGLMEFPLWATGRNCGNRQALCLV